MPPDVEWVCDRCGQPLHGQESRCNSGVHETGNGWSGRAIPVTTDEQRTVVAAWRRYYEGAEA